MIYMYNISEQTELWPTDISLRHSRNRAKCITYRVCFSLIIRASACSCLSSGSCWTFCYSESCANIFIVTWSLYKCVTTCVCNVYPADIQD